MPGRLLVPHVPEYWDTNELPDRRYRLRVRVWDTAGNLTSETLDVAIANGV